MSIRLSCPSCNHAFVLPALPDHRRAQCPRCGDAFPVRTYTEVPDAAATPEALANVADVTPLWPRRLAFVGVAVAVLLVAGFAWMMHEINRGMRGSENDSPSPGGTPRAGVKPAAQPAGLGYLRPDCNVAFAVQAGPLLRYAERTGRPPGDVLAQAGLPEPARGLLDQFGVPLAQVDHLAGGLTLGEGEDALRFELALVLNEPLADEDEFLRRLKARPVANTRNRHDVALGRFPLVLARAAPTVWVFGLDERDLSAAGKGGTGPVGLRGALADLPPDAAAWAVADDDRDWAQKPAVKLLGGVPELKALLPALKDGRGGSLAVSLGDSPRLSVRVRAADGATGAKARDYFAARAAEVEAATAGGAEATATFDSPFDLGTGKLLRRFLADAGR